MRIWRCSQTVHCATVYQEPQPETLDDTGDPAATDGEEHHFQVRQPRSLQRILS